MGDETNLLLFCLIMVAGVVKILKFLNFLSTFRSIPDLIMTIKNKPILKIHK
ncbi:hypothetical protein HanIR_Chr03g0134831 [Helianthus annuus]|nr:hypothetical protein HanIR_Chr03g0134831 [Helianthus annuus]